MSYAQIAEVINATEGTNLNATEVRRIEQSALRKLRAEFLRRGINDQNWRQTLGIEEPASVHIVHTPECEYDDTQPSVEIVSLSELAEKEFRAEFEAELEEAA